MENEQYLERPRNNRVGHVLRLGALPQHVHVILRIAELWIGVDIGKAHAMPVRACRQRRHLSDQPDNLFLTALRLQSVAHIRIEGGKGRHSADQNAHGMGIVMEAVHEFLDVLVDQSVTHNQQVPVFEFLQGWQLPSQQQKCHLQEGTVLGKLLDRIAAIAQDPSVPIQVRDGTLTGGRVHEGGIVGHQAKIIGTGLDLAQVHCANGAPIYRDSVGLPCSIVGDRQRRVVHTSILPGLTLPSPARRVPYPNRVSIGLQALR